MSQTIRQMLAQTFDADTVERIKRHGAGTAYDYLDTLCESAALCANDGGLLQTICAGWAVMSFTPASVTRRVLLLCVDDLEGEAWDVRRRAGESGPGGLPGGKPRPGPYLTLVQTA